MKRISKYFWLLTDDDIAMCFPFRKSKQPVNAYDVNIPQQFTRVKSDYVP